MLVAIGGKLFFELRRIEIQVRVFQDEKLSELRIIGINNGKVRVLGTQLITTRPVCCL
jgi:hypothetical protein